MGDARRAEMATKTHGNHAGIIEQKVGANETIKGVAEFYDFAPAPCSCCSCCVSQMQRDRQYAILTDNRFEANLPLALCCCCTCNEHCVFDRVTVIYYDKVPHRSGLCCFCCPFTCCGPPVIYVTNSKCCCDLIDCTDNCGWQLAAAPCSCFDLKVSLPRHICRINPSPLLLPALSCLARNAFVAAAHSTNRMH